LPLFHTFFDKFLWSGDPHYFQLFAVIQRFDFSRPLVLNGDHEQPDFPCRGFPGMLTGTTLVGHRGL
jgi:hypothetical protein